MQVIKGNVLDRYLPYTAVQAVPFSGLSCEAQNSASLVQQMKKIHKLNHITLLVFTREFNYVPLLVFQKIKTI